MARSFHVIKIIAHALFILFFLQIAKKKNMFQNHDVKNFENYNQLSLLSLGYEVDIFKFKPRNGCSVELFAFGLY